MSRDDLDAIEKRNDSANDQQDCHSHKLFIENVKLKVGDKEDKNELANTIISNITMDPNPDPNRQTELMWSESENYIYDINEVERGKNLMVNDGDSDDGGDNDDDDKNGDGDDTKTLDRGWAYIVLFGTFILTMSVGITGRCFGILFLRFLNELGASSTLVASIYNTESFLWSCSNLLGGPLVEVYGFRSVAMFGSLLTAVGLGSSAFAPLAEYLFFSHSLLTGIGSGLSCLVSYAIIPHYFKRLRGRANALMSMGTCLGGMLGPHVITRLQNQYGFRGATVILAAFILNNCVAATVFHPVVWHRKANWNTKVSKTASKSNLFEEVKSNANSSGNSIKVKHDEIMCTLYNKNVVSDKQSSMNKTDYNILLESKKGMNQNLGTRKFSKPKPSFRMTMMTLLRTLVKNVRVLRSATAAVLSIGGVFMIGVYLNFTMLVPFAMEAAGHTQEEASWGLSVSSACNLVARLFIAAVADLSFFSVHKIYLASNVIIISATIGFCLVEGMLMTNMVLGLWGFGIGMCYSLHPLLLVHFMGLDKYLAILGVSGILNGLWLLASGPLLGIIRDMSGSYTVTICALASSAIITVTLYTRLPYTHALDARKEGEEHRRRWTKKKVPME